MPRLIKTVFLLFALAYLLTQCTEDEGQPDISEVEIETKLKRFDQAFFETDSNQLEEKIPQLASEYPEFFSGGTNPRFWRAQRSDEKQIALYRDIQTVFEDEEALNENLDFSMKHFYHYFPEADKIKFYGYVSNLDFEYPVLFADSVNFVGLDMYLGPEKPYYQSLPSYLAFYRQPTFMIRDAMAAIVNKLVERDGRNSTLLQDMLYHGRRLYILKKLMPQKSEAVIMKYTPEQLNFAEENERSIWSYFIENEALFDTSTDLKRRFIEVAPFSKFRTKFDNDTPGMIGRWVGLQIVEAYMNNHPQVSLKELAKETDAQKILKESKYRPK